MRRSIITGFFAICFSASTFGLAAADTLHSIGPAVMSVTQATAALPATSDGGDPVPTTIVVERATVLPSPMLTLPIVRPVGKRLTPLRRFADGIMHRSSAIASSLTRSAMCFIGTPYAFGGTRSTGFDCSGYVQHVFALMGVHLPRTADAQFDAGRFIRTAMVPGDLVFFHTYAPGVSHVGIYLGHSRFIHSSSSRGVAVSSLHDRYWAPRYVGAKRVVGT